MRSISMKKYIENRKKYLKEEMILMYQRDTTNKALRKVREAMYEWDKTLLD